MAKTFDVIAVGSYCTDLVFTGLPAFPELGKEVVGTGFDMLPGETYNSVVAMHRLGVKVGWAADFGNDDFSRFSLERTRAEGLDESLFVHHRRPMRRITVAASYPEERAFITYYDPEPAVPAGLKALVTASARALFVPGFYYGRLSEAGLKLARARQIKLVMDGNSSAEDATLENPAARKAVQSVDVLLPNASEARRLAGVSDLAQAIRMLAALGPLVVVKDGARGAYACSGGEIVHAPAIRVEPLDTTGAGDCFDAGFVKAWLDGRPLEQCLQWGNVVGGLSTLARGGTGRVITAKEVEQWLRP
jgi:sugar/nucleoside kinase (ribokinase family)